MQPRNPAASLLPVPQSGAARKAAEAALSARPLDSDDLTRIRQQAAAVLGEVVSREWDEIDKLNALEASLPDDASVLDRIRIIAARGECRRRCIASTAVITKLVPKDQLQAPAEPTKDVIARAARNAFSH